MLSIQRRQAQRGASIYWHRVGYDVMWKKSVASRYRRAIERRTAIFREMAPDAYRILGTAGVEQFINNKNRDGRLRYMNSIAHFRRKIRRHFPR